MAELTQNPISFPWQMFMEAQKMKNQNQQDMYGNISGIGKGLGTIGQTISQEKAKTAIQKFLESRRNPSAQTAGAPPAQDGMDSLMSLMLPFVNSETAGQLLPPMMKSEKQANVFRPFHSLMSEEGNPLVINGSTGDVTASGIKAKSSARPFASDLGDIDWDKARPDEQQLAIALYNGDIRPYDLGYRERSRSVVLANEYANRNNLPPYQSFGGEVKGKATTAFTSGKPAMNVLSLDTAIGHAKTAMDAFNEVQNTDQRWVNVPLNKLRTMSNDPNVVKLGISLNALQGELATVFKGSAGTDQEIGKWQQFLSQDLTPGQASAAIPQVVELLKSRQDALQHMKDYGTGKRPGSGPLLSPHAKVISDEINQRGNAKPTAGVTPGLTPQEQAEYGRLHKKFGGKQ